MTCAKVKSEPSTLDESKRTMEGKKWRGKHGQLEPDPIPFSKGCRIESCVWELKKLRASCLEFVWATAMSSIQ